MDPLSENKIILVVQRTRLDDLIARFNTVNNARFYVEHQGADFSDYQMEDATYKRAVGQIKGILARHGRLQTLDRAFLPNFIFGPSDLVVALGRDGLVANILKYLDKQLLIGVNPDTDRWEGVLLPFAVSDLDLIVPEVFASGRPVRDITMARAELNNGEIMFGVNDLFIGPQTHTSARYSISVGDRKENHSSSGIIVSTGLGSTGWFRSILAGAAGITSSLENISPDAFSERAFEWDSNYLYFSVREPWPSKTSGAAIVFGKLTSGSPLILVSHMPENGVIFSDGIESDFLQFNSGTRAVISLADKKGHLVV